jgi:Fe2+ transport system protein FeoA
MPLTLAQLAVGQQAVIQSLPTGRVGLTRLRELGLTPGALVRLVRTWRCATTKLPISPSR